MAAYVTADIHGSFSLLWGALKELGFSPGKDQLYSLGDLVNRGAESASVLQWLQKPWFKAIRGNHEAMVIRAWSQPDDKENLDLLRSVNGHWWFDLPKAQQEQVANGLASLPYYRQVNVGDKVLGLVHADVPEEGTWQTFCESLDQHDEDAIEVALWARGRWREAVSRGVPEDCLVPVKGIDAVFLGHSPVEQPTKIGNVIFADCGLWRGNSSGVICLDSWCAANL